MSDLLDAEATGERKRVGTAVVATLLVLLAAVAVGVFLVFQFVQAERERDLRAWQVRLGIVADSRAAAIEAWLVRQRSTLTDVADGDSIRILLTQLKRAGGELAKVPDGLAQAEYLERFLTVTADQNGYKNEAPGPVVPENLPNRGVAGLAVLGANGLPVASTPGVPLTEDELADFIAKAPPGKEAIHDLFLDVQGKPAIAFLEPIYAVQAQPVPELQVGWVLGVKEIGAETDPLLRQPGATEASAEALLVEKQGAVVAFLSPLQGGKGPLSLKLAVNTPDLAEAAALEAPGGFGIRKDYRDKDVLYTSRPIPGLPWVLVYKVDRDEALGETDRRERRLLIILLLGIAVVTAGVVALWRHGASRRASEAAVRYRKLAERFEYQGRFLRLVTDTQPNVIFIADEENRYRFANRKTGEEAHASPDDLIGKTLAAVLGPAAAKRYERLNRAALDEDKAVTDVHRLEAGQSHRVVQSQHLPLAPTPQSPRGVLVVEEDITAAVLERERRERTLDQLVRSLVAIVDRRNPFAAHHSTRVAMVARAIAAEMGLEPKLVEAAEHAGNLMNLGRILVPSEVLRRAGRLSEDEMTLVRNSIEASADFLQGIEFDGPVVETLRQANEHVDGSGRPKGLKGDQILPTAKVIAVANAFVGMRSPRAHRPGLGADETIAALLADVGTQYERGVVAALINYLDNKGGRAAWANFSDPPPKEGIR
jgi:HD-GYP domain-containing protein (c-di-GMP phosphodiesterase class II)